MRDNRRTTLRYLGQSSAYRSRRSLPYFILFVLISPKLPALHKKVHCEAYICKWVCFGISGDGLRRSLR